MNKLKNLFHFIFLLLILHACSSDNSEEEGIEPQLPKYLVNAQKITNGAFSTDQIRSNLAFLTLFDSSFSFLNNYADRIQFNVESYKITYKTEYLDGEEIEASGLLILPKTGSELSIFSYQHGTITSDSEAPSNFPLLSEPTQISVALASLGYMTIAPDYIGYGASNDIEHPYEHKALTASACRDMLRAAKEFAIQEGKALNEKLFLAGYSQGGAATMAMHKLLQTQHSDEFTVTASMPAAGAYNKRGFTEFIVTQNGDLNFMDFYIWVLGSYNSIYELNRPYTFYFTKPNVSYIASTPLNLINVDSIDSNPQNLFTQELREGITNGTDQELLAAINDNNVFDWSPQAPVIMYHGTDDDFVPFFNAEDALAAMQAQGTPNVQLVPIDGGDHFTSVAPYFEGVLQSLDLLQ